MSDKTSDTINRQSAIDAINKSFERVFAWDGASPLGDKVLENVPSAQPRMKGRWTKGINENGVTTSLFCSECNYENKHWYEWNYCPNCGADMRGEQDGRFNQQAGSD